MALLVSIVLVTVALAFVCSLLEAVLYSTRTGTLEVEKSAGTRKSDLAHRFLEMKRNISAPIASIVIMSTVANTAGATLVGAYAGQALGTAAMPIFSAIFFLLMLLGGEICPKTIGALHWRSLWAFVVWPVTVMRYALYPVIVVTQWFSDLFSHGRIVPTVTEDEILAIVRMGAREGEISHDESQLVHNIINLEDQPLRAIMTPRTVLFSLDADMAVEEACRAVDGKGFTRIPIWRGERENINGYILIHDLFSIRTQSNPKAPLGSISKPITFVPETTNSLALLTTFLKQRRHIAIVVDEWGGVAGLVTLEDLIETILGREIVDETDRVVDLQEQARKTKPQRLSK
jgi:CBS domain containing-hemolysin-like protein